MARRKQAPEKSESDITLEKVVSYYEASVESTHDSRKLSERDRDYTDNKQWTAEERSVIEKRGEPVITKNRIKPKVDFLLGLERKNRTDPRAAPRTLQDQDASEAATDAIRYVCDADNFSQTRSDVFDNIIVEGMGGAIVEVDEAFEIHVRQIPWDRIFYDPHSRTRLFHDSKYKGVVAWMDEDDAVTLYGEKAKDVIELSLSMGDASSTYDDKPLRMWIDYKRKRVKFCELYYQKAGTWYYCVFTKAGFIVEPKPSQYLDEDSEPICPIELTSCYVDRENNRYGTVRQYISPQDEINKRSSKALHLMSVRQVKVERGAVASIPELRRQLSKPDGVAEVNPGMMLELLPTGDMAAAQFQLLQEGKQEIEAGGANNALQGKGPESQSGRALQARQEGGLTELGPVLDGLRMWQREIYRQIWYRVKQYWTEERWIRITDDEKNIRFAALNRQTTYGEMAMKKAQALPPDQLQALQTQIQADPQSIQPMVENDVSRMDMDIILEDAPDTVSIQSEQFEMLAEMYKANPQNPQNPKGIPFEAVLELSALRNKKQLLEKMQGQQGGPQGPSPAQQMAEQMIIEEKKAEVATKQANAMKAQADAARAAEEARKAKIDADGSVIDNNIKMRELEVARQPDQMDSVVSDYLRNLMTNRTVQ